MNKGVNQYHPLTMRAGGRELAHKILDKRLQAAGRKPFVLICLLVQGPGADPSTVCASCEPSRSLIQLRRGTTTRTRRVSANGFADLEHTCATGIEGESHVVNEFFVQETLSTTLVKPFDLQFS